MLLMMMAMMTTIMMRMIIIIIIINKIIPYYSLRMMIKLVMMICILLRDTSPHHVRASSPRPLVRAIDPWRHTAAIYITRRGISDISQAISCMARSP